MAFKIHLSRLFIDPIPNFHEMYGIIDERSWHSSSDCNISCMKVHMATLDAFDAQSSKGSEILSKANAQHNLSKLCSVWELQDFECV